MEQLHLSVRNVRKHCSRCPRSFRNGASLRNHESRAHLIDSTFKCSKCPETFPSAVKLYQHQRQVHRAPPVVCEECGLKVAAERFKEHTYIHTGEKPYGCGQCSLKFRQSPVSSVISILIDAREIFPSHRKHLREVQNLKPTGRKRLVNVGLVEPLEEFYLHILDSVFLLRFYILNVQTCDVIE